MYASPPPVTCMHTPQREFASAKVLLFSELHKKICTFDADFSVLSGFCQNATKTVTVRSGNRMVME